MPQQGPHKQQIIESELLGVLTRLLPAGWEGIAHAQVQATIAVLERRSTHRFRPITDAQSHMGMIRLRRTAEAHQQSAYLTQDGSQVCGCCVGPKGRHSLWPCDVWAAAALLNLTPTEAPRGLG